MNIWPCVQHVDLSGYGVHVQGHDSLSPTITHRVQTNSYRLPNILINLYKCSI